MPPEGQNYGSHRRYIPLFHFVVLPILALNLIARILYIWKAPGVKLYWWELVVAFALAALAFTVRTMATTLQDRIIRLEETLRLGRLLPDDLKGRVGELSTSQLIGLRFCSDGELAELTRVVLTEPVHKREDIKKRIKNWRSDTGPRA